MSRHHPAAASSVPGGSSSPAVIVAPIVPGGGIAIPATSSAAVSAVPNVTDMQPTSPSEHAQHVYVTVDTGSAPPHVYFEGQQQQPVAIDPAAFQQLPPGVSRTVVIRSEDDLAPTDLSMRSAAALATPASIVPETSNKLDALAMAASTQEPIPDMTQQQQQQQPLLCGECMASFWSSQEFFDHWIRLHCRPREPGSAVAVVAPDDAAAAGGLPPLRHCERCNRVFIYGMQRFLEHSLTCGGAGDAREPSATAAPAPIAIAIPPPSTRPAVAVVVPTTSVAGVKRPQQHVPTATVVDKRAKEASSSSSAISPNLPQSQAASATSTSSGSIVSCGICSATIRTITSFFLHWLDHHDKIIEILEEVWQCGQCSPNRLFPTRANLETHVDQAHPFAGAAKSTAFECSKGCFGGAEEETPARFCTSPELEAHFRLHSADACPVCGDEDPKDIVRHHRESHESECRLCKCRVLSDELDRHLAQKHLFEMVWNRTRSLQKINSASKDSAASKSAEGGGGADAKRKAKKMPKPAPIVAAPDPTPAAAAAAPTPRKSAGVPAAGGGWRCRACNQFFNSEKLLEKHYFANHEFQCKFCDKTMDKDEYGDHLRLHLASERKKAAVGAATGATSSSSSTSQQKARN